MNIFTSGEAIFNLDGYDSVARQYKYEVQNVSVPEGYFIFRKYLYEGYSLFLMHKNDGVSGNAQDGEALLFVERNRNVKKLLLYFHCDN